MIDKFEKYETPIAKEEDKEMKTITGAIKTSALTLVWLLVLGGFVWSFYNYLLVKKDVYTPEDLVVQEDFELNEKMGILEKVGMLMILPTDEDPMIATITDIEMLKKQQDFYAEALNDDKVILYPKAKKAIIYRPGINKIINIGPMVIEEKANQK